MARKGASAQPGWAESGCLAGLVPGARPANLAGMTDLLVFIALLWLASAAAWVLAGWALDAAEPPGSGRMGDGR